MYYIDYLENKHEYMVLITDMTLYTIVYNVISVINTIYSCLNLNFSLKVHVLRVLEMPF